MNSNGFKFHGNFCGDNIPNVKAKSKEEEFKILSAIKPIDIIDKACKKHDICYLQRGRDAVSCDNELVLEMENIHDKLNDDACKRFSQSIIYYFRIKNDNFITLLDSGESLSDKMIKLPSVSFKNAINTAQISSIAGVNYTISKPYGYIFDPKKNSQRRKEVLQIFPPRYKKCEISE
ncbi:MAG: hypothetical protein H8E76_05780 [Helicobacteraceae bacterium]|nr:hypothetical protein [Candidatus Sulfurimonas ponti]MBL6973459.1 hypothetical protein [Sulfurimonas sp.]